MVKLSTSSAALVKQSIFGVLADSKPLSRLNLQIAVQERLSFQFSPVSFKGMLKDLAESGALGVSKASGQRNTLFYGLNNVKK